MIRRALPLALLAAVAGAAAAPFPAAAQVGASDGTVMRRTTLLVYEIERSMRFYEILGYTR